jgi:endo-1,4-beta-mannosidase
VEFNNDTMLGQIVKNESKFIQKAVETILYWVIYLYCFRKKIDTQHNFCGKKCE